MASAEYGQRFRNAVGDPGGANPVFDDTVIDDYFAQAEEKYPDESSEVHLAYAITLGFENLLAQSAHQVTYKANASTESLSHMFDHYRNMLSYWRGRLATALTDDLPSVMWGSMDKTPRTDVEYPDA